MKMRCLSQMLCCCVIALEARENDVTFEEDHSIQLYAPVTSAGQTTQTDTNNHYLSQFQQFCIPSKVCNSSYYVEAGIIHRQMWSGQSDLLVGVLGIKFLSVRVCLTAMCLTKDIVCTVLLLIM